ncbi:MAG: peptide chain release factor N(5)-glutamine methyltransferase [Acidobacteria bacterium]|nr:peptide chain release factor N(5)-glutamine methyltransferase [Acidobacteriota bacterium]
MFDNTFIVAEPAVRQYYVGFPRKGQSPAHRNRARSRKGQEQRMNIQEAIQNAAAKLAASGVAEPLREASSLLGYVLGRDRTFLIAHPEYVLSEKEADELQSVIVRRAAREPYQYIVGKQEFYGLEMLVTPDVLIPRPETELLVDQGLEHLRSSESKRFCEIGVGSGCVTVAILVNEPDAQAVALDVSEKALAIAQANAERHGVADRVEFRSSDIFSSFNSAALDLIVSNPPYIADAEMSDLQPEVRDHEPHLALSDNGDGLGIIRQIIQDSPQFLRLGGALMLEIGHGQEPDVSLMFDPENWAPPNVYQDLAGIPRVVTARRSA